MQNLESSKYGKFIHRRDLLQNGKEEYSATENITSENLLTTLTKVIGNKTVKNFYDVVDWDSCILCQSGCYDKENLITIPYNQKEVLASKCSEYISPIYKPVQQKAQTFQNNFSYYMVVPTLNSEMQQSVDTYNQNDLLSVKINYYLQAPRDHKYVYEENPPVIEDKTKPNPQHIEDLIQKYPDLPSLTDSFLLVDGDSIKRDIALSARLNLEKKAPSLAILNITHFYRDKRSGLYENYFRRFSRCGCDDIPVCLVENQQQVKELKFLILQTVNDILNTTKNL